MKLTMQQKAVPQKGTCHNCLMQCYEISDEEKLIAAKENMT